jgi:hypothetical protein
MKLRRIVFSLLLFLPLCSFAQFTTDQVVNDFIRNHGDQTRASYAMDYAGHVVSQPSLFSALDFSTYELLSSSFQFADKNNVQKIVLSPFRLGGTKSGVLEGIRLNASLNNDITTLGAAFGHDNSSPNSKRTKAIITKVYSGLPAYTGSTPQQFADYAANVLDQARIQYNEERMRRVFRYSIGYNVQLFGSLFAQGSANKFDSLNYHNIKSTTVSGTLSHSWNNGDLDLSATYNHIMLRTSAAQFDAIKPYRGPSATIKKRIYKLLKKEDLEKSPDYLKSGFIPSIDFGIAFEGKYYMDDDLKFAEKGIKTLEVWTFFFDFKISPASQFRLGLPLTETTSVSKDKKSVLGTTIQYSFKLVNLN